jgi:hypothetical protein
VSHTLTRISSYVVSQFGKEMEKEKLEEEEETL